MSLLRLFVNGSAGQTVSLSLHLSANGEVHMQFEHGLSLEIQTNQGKFKRLSSYNPVLTASELRGLNMALVSFENGFKLLCAEVFHFCMNI